MRKIGLIVVLFISFFSCKKQALDLEIGKTVPNYVFKTVLNGEQSEMSLAVLRGKAVILEFWATWCGPCIPAMKKLDSLQLKFENDLQVVTVSSENVERLEKFITTTHTSLPIASDTSHYSVFEYKIIPHTILIDKKGIVRAITSPENITEQLIQDLISDKSISVTLKDDYYMDPTLEVKMISSEATKDYRIELKNYDQEKRGGYAMLKAPDGTVNGIDIWNSPIPRLYQTLFDVSSPHRIQFMDDLSYDDFPYQPDHQYNLLVEASPETDQNWRHLGIEFLNKHFGINAKMGVDSLTYYVLRKNDSLILKESTAKEPSFMFMGPILKAKQIEISGLIEYIENFTDVPVVDQTNLEGYYDIELEWQTEDPKTLFSELQKLGLTLERYDGKLPVEVMQIYKKNMKL